MRIMYINSKSNFNLLLEQVNQGLASHDISVKHEKSFDMLSRTLANKAWSSFSPSLPVEVNAPGDDAASTMQEWLKFRNKRISCDDCRNILEKAVLSVPDLWFDSGEMKYIKNDVAPLFNHFKMDDSANNACICIDPRNKSIYTLGYYPEGDPARVYQMRYYLPVPGDAPGHELYDIMQRQDFMRLVNGIMSSWTSEWNGSSHVGILSKKVNIEWQDFYEYLEKDHHFTQADVYTAHQYLLDHTDVVGYDKNGKEISYDGQYEWDAVVVVFNEKYKLTTETDIDELEKEITEDLSDNEKVVGINKLLHEFQALFKNK